MLFRTKTSRAIGQVTETLACQYLEKQGLIFHERNFHCRAGEIDLLMIDNKTLVFVEVRYRKNTQFGHALETIGTTKQKKLINTAQYYLQNHPKYKNQPARFDVVSISGHPPQYDINWIKDAFQALP